MKVQFNEIMASIIRGLINGNEEQVIGNMLLQTEFSVDELTANDEEAFNKIYDFLTPRAFSILIELHEQLSLEVLDENGEVLNFDEE